MSYKNLQTTYNEIVSAIKKNSEMETLKVEKKIKQSKCAYTLKNNVLKEYITSHEGIYSRTIIMIISEGTIVKLCLSSIMNLCHTNFIQAWIIFRIREKYILFCIVLDFSEHKDQTKYCVKKSSHNLEGYFGGPLKHYFSE